MENKTYALFLGCTIPARVRQYEQSVRAVAQRLGIRLVDLEGFACCGFPLEPVDHHAALALGARNLALAEEAGLPICTLCSSCTSALCEVSRTLSRNEEERERTNRLLAKIQRRFQSPVEVRHFVRILLEDMGLDRIREACVRPLDGIRLAAHYGCHLLKPTEIHQGFDSVEDPRVLDDFIRSTGAVPVDYSRKKQCCGGSVLMADQRTALEIARDKLAELRDLEVDALVVVCPFCGVMYDSNQKVMEKIFEETYGIPVLYLPQVLGLAMGMEEKTLGLKSHAVKTKGLLEKLQAQAEG
jgi:heterodisulfide reductase subunit B